MTLFLMRGSWHALWDGGKRKPGRTRCVLRSVVEHGKLLGHMGGMPSCVWFTCLEVLVLFVNVVVSGRGSCPLACRSVLLRRTGSRSSLLFCACFPSFPCASEWSRSCLFLGLHASVCHLWCG
jgi:hypothetical protein